MLMNEEVIIAPKMYVTNEYYVFRSSGEEIPFSIVAGIIRDQKLKRLTEKEKQFIKDNII
jgi:hypothetical protein